jgi:hypothetical protein
MVNEALFQDFVRGAYCNIDKERLFEMIDNEVYGLDIHGAYPSFLKEELPYGDILFDKPNSPAYEYLNLVIESFKMKKE